MAIRNIHIPSLVEFIDSEKLFDSSENRNQLIRILSRSSNLPKVHNINIYLHQETMGYEILPGKSLKIGSGILGNPVVALMYIRYGLEWQVWYKCQDAKNIDPRICDLAASQVTAKFYETLSLKDKKSLINFPEQFLGIFRKFKTGHHLPTFSSEDFAILGEMNPLTYPAKPISEEALKIINHLAFPLEYMLMSGGDKRLKIDRKHLLNKYGCTPFPRPKAYSFASSTATSISNIAFTQTEEKRETLIQDCFTKGFEATISAYADQLKNRLQHALDLPQGTEVILGPSGTDIALLFAGLCQSIFSKKLVHILVASDETGSGVPAALLGQHFSDRSSQEVKVQKGAPIKGFEEVEMIAIPLRKEDGQLKTNLELDREVEEAFDRVLAEEKQPILHVMNQSKLGYTAPSANCLLRMEETYKEDFFALIDNSQMRMGRYELNSYLQRNYAMTITGSKFFTGPPFCGALLLPKTRESLASQSTQPLPQGMIDYVYKNDFPEDWQSTAFLHSGNNLGTLMRWHAAIVEQERYFTTPVLLRNLGTEMFCTHVKNSLAHASFLEALTDDEQDKAGGKPTSPNRSIFAFFILKDGKVLELEQARRVYHRLNQKLSLLTSQTEKSTLSDQVCHIGQPVKAVYEDGTISGVLRISLGARVISESWKEQDISLYFQKIEEQVNQVDTIIRKIELILQQPELWEQ